MTGLIISRVEQKTVNYCVQSQESKKQLGWIKKDVMSGWVFQAEFQCILNSQQIEELNRHVQELNKK